MYRELMYGEATETLQASNSDSEVVINKPVSRVNTPAHYDSSSEDSMLNERIAKRREQMGVFEKEKVCKKFFISSDSDSSVAMASTKPKQKKRKTSVNTCRTTRSSFHVKIGTRARLASSTTAGAPQQKNSETKQHCRDLPSCKQEENLPRFLHLHSLLHPHQQKVAQNIRRRLEQLCKFFKKLMLSVTKIQRRR